MARGRAWSVEEELRLKELVEEGMSASDIAVSLGKTKLAVANKLSRLGLKDDGVREKPLSSSSSSGGLDLLVDLPSVEDAVKVIGAVMLALAKPGLSKDEVYKLKTEADVASKFIEARADLVDYKALEKQIVELKRKFEELAAEKKDFSNR